MSQCALLVVEISCGNKYSFLFGKLRLSEGVGVHRLIDPNSNIPFCHTRRRRRARERSKAGDEDRKGFIEFES